jgi:hypothetical protein
MKALLLAAAAISGLGTSSAHADGGVPPANTMFTSFPACSRRPSMSSRQGRASRAWRIMPPSRTVSRGRSRRTRTAAITNKQRTELEAGTPTIARQSSGFAETPQAGRPARWNRKNAVRHSGLQKPDVTLSFEVRTFLLKIQGSASAVKLRICR